MANQKIQLDITADVVKFQSGINAAIDRIDRLATVSRSQTSSIATNFSSLGKAVVGFFAAREMVGYVDQIRQIADQYTNINARLKLVTDSSEEYRKVQDQLYKTSQETGSEYAANADSYSKLAVSLKGVGAKSEEVLRINELVNKSLVVNGSSTEEASSFMLQFAQAMGSGVLQGDEFKAMMESNGFFAQQLAKSMNTDIAGLRAMSKEGKLTTDVLRQAFPQMAEEINAAFAKIPATTQRAMTALQNSFYKIIDDSNNASGATGGISAEIIKLAQTIDTNREGIVSLFTAIIAGAGNTVVALANIGQSFAGWKAVGDGRLRIFEFATMDAKELNSWIKINATDVGKIDAQITQLRTKQKQVASEGYYSKEGIAEKNAALAAIRGQIAALEDQKKKIIETAGVSKSTSVSMSENATTSYEKITTSATVAATTQKQVQAAALDAMKTKYQQYASEIKRLQDEISGRENSLYMQLRDMARTGMSGIDAWSDLKKQAQEYAAVAKTAFESGDFATAIQFADQAKEMYSQLNTEVREGDDVLVTQSDALKTSMEGVKQAGELGISALKGQQEAANNAMNVLKESSGFQDLSKGMDDAESKWLANWQRMQAAAVKDIAVVEDRLLAIKDKDVTVWVNEKVRKSTGGPVAHFARGGKLSGYGGGDRISALLEAGEFIVRKEAVARFGVGVFNRLNSLQLPVPTGFATGGQIGAAVSPAGASYAITLNYNGSGSSTDAKGMAKMVMAELQRMHRRAA